MRLSISSFKNCRLLEGNAIPTPFDVEYLDSKRITTELS
jgi:hypothetical protein